MATPAFQYQDPFPLANDETKYRLLGKEGVSVATFEGKEILKVEPEALDARSRARRCASCSFFLRPAHNEQVAKILADPEASQNDKGVALAFLRNAEIAAQRRAAHLPGHRHRHHRRQEGAAGLDRREGRGVPLQGRLRDLHRGEPALLADRARSTCTTRSTPATNLPAQIDLYATDGRRVQVPLRRQGRRLGQQDHALPGDQGAAQPGAASRSSSSRR